jgi:pilus assembly protein CpaD
MNTYRAFAVAGVLLAIAACQPLPATYTSAEAPKTIALSNATAHFGLRFVAGSARLQGVDAARLRRWVAHGMIQPSDRVSVATAGPPALAAARFATISRALLRYRIVADRMTPAALPPNRAVIDSVRYLVTLPPCPNWSKPPDGDFTNAPASNFGCANADNLALMVASPADLVSGRALGPTGGKVAAAAVARYDIGQVVIPETFNDSTSSAVSTAVSTAASGSH